jgi:hypothetical protein
MPPKKRQREKPVSKIIEQGMARLTKRDVAATKRESFHAFVQRKMAEKDRSAEDESGNEPRRPN